MSHTRRNFLATTALGAAAVGAAPNAALAAESAKPVDQPMRLSIMAYSFHGLMAEGKMDVFGYLESCRYRYHLGAADLWNGNKGFLTSLEPEYLKKVRDAIDERGLVLAGLAVDWAEIWVDSPEQREQFYKNSLAHLKAASILRPRFVRIDAGGKRGTREWPQEQFDHIVKRYKEYARIAHDSGFLIGAENHWGPEKYWPSMQKLYRAVDRPAFRISCHLGGWEGTEEEKAQADREAAPWVAHTHIPWNITEGPLVERMNNLRNAGYQGYYSVEHHSGKQEYTEVGIQLAKVRAVLESWRTGGDGADTSTRRSPRTGA